VERSEALLSGLNLPSMVYSGVRSVVVAEHGVGQSGRSNRWATVPALAVGVVLLAAFAAPLHIESRFSIFPQDEGLLLVYPSLLLHGAVPSRDFESVYGATNLWVIAAAFKLFGTSVVVERAVGIGYRLVILGSVVVIAWRRRGPLAATVAGAVCIVFLAGTLGLAAFAWVGALAFASFALLMVDIGLSGPARGSPLVVGGVAFGCAVGCRLDMGLAIVLALGVVAFLRRESIRWLALGVVVGLVPILVNVVQAGVGAVFRDQVYGPIFVSGPHRRLPLSTLSRQELILLVLTVVVALATVLTGVLGLRRDRHDWGRVSLLVMGVFELGLLPEAFQRTDSLHLALVSCFILPAGVLLPPWGIRRAPFNLMPVLVGVVALVLSYPYFGRTYWSAVGVGKPQPMEYLVTGGGRQVPLASEQDQVNLTALLHAVDMRAKPGQRIFVGPRDLRTANYEDTFIYFLLPQLVPGSHYLEMNPGIANGTNSRLASDLSRDDFLILTSRYDNGAGLSSAVAHGGTAPNSIVKTQFTPVGTFGAWTLFERNPASRT